MSWSTFPPSTDPSCQIHMPSPANAFSAGPRFSRTCTLTGFDVREPSTTRIEPLAAQPGMRTHMRFFVRHHGATLRLAPLASRSTTRAFGPATTASLMAPPAVTVVSPVHLLSLTEKQRTQLSLSGVGFFAASATGAATSSAPRTARAIRVDLANMEATESRDPKFARDESIPLSAGCGRAMNSAAAPRPAARGRRRGDLPETARATRPVPRGQATTTPRGCSTACERSAAHDAVTRPAPAAATSFPTELLKRRRGGPVGGEERLDRQLGDGDVHRRAERQDRREEAQLGAARVDPQGERDVRTRIVA